jgi:two-component system nitrate/nitrite response regulator NarL
VDVLLCDDHVVFANCLADLLTSQGFDVKAVTYEPGEAIRALRRVRIDVAVLDVAYGEQTLLDHLPAIRDASPSTRLVVLTGRLDDETVSSCRAAGIAGFAEKRQSGNAITVTIERVAAGEVVLPAPSRRVEPTPRATANATARRLAAYLTARERQVLSLLTTGCDTASLARALGITQATARSHVQSALIKLNVHSRLEAATTVVRSGLVDPATGDWLA